MNDPHPSFAALILWGVVAAAVGYRLWRGRTWLTLFWVAGSVYLPVLALTVGTDSGAAPPRHYRLVAFVTLAAGVVFPVLGAVAGGLRFWSTGAAMFSPQATGEPSDPEGPNPAGSGGPPKDAEHGRRPGSDA